MDAARKAGLVMEQDEALSILFSLALARREQAEALSHFSHDTSEGPRGSYAMRAALCKAQADALDWAVAKLMPDEGQE